MKPGKDCIGVSVFALVFDLDGKVLLGLNLPSEKKGKEYENIWSMPGGTMEFGETAEETLRREIKEETNVEIDNVELISYNDMVRPDEHKHWLALNFKAKATNSEPKNCEPEKFADVKFFAPNEIPENISKFCREALTKIGIL